jgi:hypothetical protein
VRGEHRPVNFAHADKSELPVFYNSPGTLSVIVHGSHLTYSRLNMKDRTDTLGIGSSAPDFSLPAANRDGVFTLREFLIHGPVIVEFLRGTW